jgi:hypothetical protein
MLYNFVSIDMPVPNKIYFSNRIYPIVKINFGMLLNYGNGISIPINRQATLILRLKIMLSMVLRSIILINLNLK